MNMALDTSGWTFDEFILGSPTDLPVCTSPDNNYPLQELMFGSIPNTSDVNLQMPGDTSSPSHSPAISSISSPDSSPETSPEWESVKISPPLVDLNTDVIDLKQELGLDEDSVPIDIKRNPALDAQRCDPPEVKKRKRMARNRESANISRERKRVYTSILEQKLKSVLAENRALVASLHGARVEVDILKEQLNSAEEDCAQSAKRSRVEALPIDQAGFELDGLVM